MAVHRMEMENKYPEFKIKDGIILCCPPGHIQFQLCTMVEVVRDELTGGRWGRRISVVAPNGYNYRLFIPTSSYGYKKDEVIEGLLDHGLFIFDWAERFLVLDYIFRPIKGLPAADWDEERRTIMSNNELPLSWWKFWERW